MPSLFHIRKLRAHIINSLSIQWSNQGQLIATAQWRHGYIVCSPFPPEGAAERIIDADHTRVHKTELYLCQKRRKAVDLFAANKRRKVLQEYRLYKIFKNVG